ncbi:MAG: leucine-rich repeat protein [Hyphomicrobiaceae bacterium]|nr:leucine-rich repeat protein [Hyphomicrobiaceae bacterium]
MSGISTKLPDGVFDKLSNLSFLWFGDNTLTELPDRVFDGLTNLTDMYLAGNGFTKLPDGVFDKLANLDGLNLRENALTELPDGVFDKLTGLSGLVVHSNPLTELPEGVFDGLTNLESLNLDLYESSRSPRQSPMTELPDGVFDDLVNLKRLFLRSGALTKLPEGVFDNLANLAWLDAALYNLTELPEGVFRKLTSMRKLEFYGGAMTELPEGIFARNAGAVDLQELSFRYGDSASDVDMTPQFVRTDAGNFAPGPASVVFSLPQGAPRTLTWALSVKGASLFADTVTVPAGATISAPFTLTRNEDHIGHVRLRAEKTWNFGGVRGIWFPQDDPEIRLFPRADMPQNLGVAAADRSLTAVWNRPADDKRVLGYTVRWKLATAENFATDNTYTTKIQWPRETSYTIEGLQNGLTYDVEVAARIYALRGSWGGRLEFSDFVKAQGVPGKSRFRLNVLGGDSPSARDGTAIMRYLLGVRGKSLLAGLANGQPRVVELKIAEAAKNGELDVDRSGQVDSTDGALIVRYLLGLRNDALVADLKVASEAKDIAKNIEELKPASAS